MGAIVDFAARVERAEIKEQKFLNRRETLAGLPAERD